MSRLKRDSECESSASGVQIMCSVALPGSTTDRLRVLAGGAPTPGVRIATHADSAFRVAAVPPPTPTPTRNAGRGVHVHGWCSTNSRRSGRPGALEALTK